MNTEYAFVQESDAERLQMKVNRLAADGWYMQVAYGVPDHRGMTHCAWMYRSTPKVDVPFNTEGGI